MLHTRSDSVRLGFGLQGFRWVCLYTTSSALDERIQILCSIDGKRNLSHNRAVTCARDQITIPLVTPTSAHLRSEMSDRHGSALGSCACLIPLPCGSRFECGPTRRVDAKSPTRWRSGLVRPPDPARGCRDRSPALPRSGLRLTVPAGLVWAVFHGREADWMLPLRRRWHGSAGASS